MKSKSACLVWNSTTRDFALVSYELAQAMLGMGNTEGFDRLSRHPGKGFRVVIRPFRSTGCTVDIETKAGTYSHQCGRVEGKKLAAQLHKHFEWPVFNVKNTGKLVPCTIPQCLPE